MLKQKRKKKKKFVIIEPVKEAAQIIDYIPEKKKEDTNDAGVPENVEGDLPEDFDYLNNTLDLESDDEEDIHILEQQLFQNDEEHKENMHQKLEDESTDCSGEYNNTSLLGNILITEPYNY